MNNEEIRDQYRPSVTKVLFVGESPPESGNFFYRGDSLTTHVQMAFERALEVKFKSHEPFLQCFKALGCFLDDLSHVPVNGFPPPERESLLKQSVPSFCERLKSLNPKAIIVSPMKIKPHIEEATRRISPTAIPQYLPYPAYNKENCSRFVNKLSEILIQLRRNGIL